MIARSVVVLMLAAGLLAAQSKPAAESRPESGPAGDASAFAPLFKYCQAQVESVMCISAERVPEELKELTLVGGEFRSAGTVRCSRALHASRKFLQRGDYEGVEIFELAKPLPSLADALEEDNYSHEVIAGVTCFVHKPATGDEADWGGPLENWIALIDRRWLICATRRAILRDVIGGRGPTPEACLERLGWKAGEIDWGAPIIVARKYDPSNRQDQYSPVNAKIADSWPKPRGFQIDRVLFTYETAKKKGRMEVITKDPDASLKYFRALAGDPRLENGKTIEGQVEPRAVDLVGSQGDRYTFSLNLNGQEAGLGGASTPFLIYGHSPYIL